MRRTAACNNRHSLVSTPESLQRVIPPALKPLAKAIYHRLFRLKLGVQIWREDHRAMPSAEVPIPPAVLRYRVSESLSVDEFLHIGKGCAELIQRHVQESGVDLRVAQRVLDFGCGCGRTLSWFLARNGVTEFHGADVDAEAIAWCTSHLPSGHFLASTPLPPLPYATGHFDVVYCLSVFTHLNETMQDSWLAELSRILKPGGLLLLTVYGQSATGALDADGQRLLKTQGFVHRRSQKLRGLVPEWYHTTWHSRQYIVKRLGKWFKDIRYREVPDGKQDVITARKAG
jgi:2-polyprenyl-3-methyl-5-hydroxy-6-metoxy-1,4-benzoquinol methylase